MPQVSRVGHYRHLGWNSSCRDRKDRKKLESESALREKPENRGGSMNAEVKESDSEIMPRMQHKRKGDLANQHIEFQDSVQC